MRIANFDRPGRLLVRDIAAVLVTLFAVSALSAETTDATGARDASSAAQTSASATLDPDGAPAQSAAGASRPLSFSTGRLRNGSAHRGKVDSSALPSSKQRGVVNRALGTGIYVYDAVVDLYFDEDDDGFYSGLDVVFDVDTDFPVVDVYARLYLSLEGGPWEAYFTTDLYGVYGATADDEYIVETELFSDYPRGYYDVLIEIYDADDFLVASFGPQDSSAVSILPLEDAGRDAPFVAAPIVVTSGGGGGALGPVWMLALGIVAALRRAGARRAALARPSDTGRARNSAPQRPAKARAAKRQTGFPARLVVETRHSLAAAGAARRDAPAWHPGVARRRNAAFTRGGRSRATRQLGIPGWLVVETRHSLAAA